MSFVSITGRRVAAVLLTLYAAPLVGTLAGTVCGFFATMPAYQLVDGILIVLVLGVPMIAVEVAKSRIRTEED